MKQLSTTHLKDFSKWIRLAYMLVVAVIFYFVLIYLILFIALFQMVYALLTGKPNANLGEFNQGLCQYITSICQYLTYVSDTKPFPFEKWSK